MSNNQLDCERIVEPVNKEPLKSISVRSVCDLPHEKNVLPTKLFTFNGLSAEHVVIKYGELTDMPYVRIHSECLTGDVFGSLRCDCKKQLTAAVKLLSKKGGLLIYLRQEGRGIGLYNKIAAYHLQDNGFNTYEANQRLGFADDCRSYNEAAALLKLFNITKVKLITNNSEKITNLEQQGLFVKRIKSKYYINTHNKSYILAKLANGHLR